MQIEPRASYLALHNTKDAGKRRLTIASDLAKALSGWTAGSRVSPIWTINTGEAKRKPSLDGRSAVLFVGPVSPGRLAGEVAGIDSALSIWASFGCFNLIIQTANDEAGVALAQRLRGWASTAALAYEEWRLEDGVILSSQQRTLDVDNADALHRNLVSHSAAFNHPALRPTFQENLVATATALTRSAAVYLPAYRDLSLTAAAMDAIMGAFSRHEISTADMQSRLLTMNAALSRFSSQAFSGIPSIQSTECHFWIHSLLGTGCANFALSNLVSFIQRTLGEARLPERVAALSAIRERVPSLADLTDDIRLLDFDIMERTEIAEAISSPVIPLVTYFSGRDGFSSHVQTLSAPLTTLAECNSYRSNLLTVTHEITHVLIQSILSILSPTRGQDQDFSQALQLLSPQYQAVDYLEAARQLFLEAVISIATLLRAGQTPFTQSELDASLPEIIESTRLEVQEILVHTFDFLYFHSGEPTYYIENIWYSWCSIPGIQDRISEYLMRTLCAVSANLLRENPTKRFPAALKHVKEILSSLAPKIDVETNYVALAIEHIDKLESNSEAKTAFSREYAVRMRLVRLVSIFLFSDTISSSLFSDPHMGGGEGYRAKRVLTYDEQPIGNPLQFLRSHLKASPTEAESMWVLHSIAFDASPTEAPT